MIDHFRLQQLDHPSKANLQMVLVFDVLRDSDKALDGQRRRSKAYPELEMTEHVRQHVHEAATMMLEMCDGAITRDDAGFSKADAMMARHLYRRFRQDERIDQALERMLARYHRQLRDDFPELYATQLNLAA